MFVVDGGRLDPHGTISYVSGSFSSSIGSMGTAQCKLRAASEARRMTLVFALGFVLVQSSTAQTAEQYRQRAIEASHAESWDDAVTNYRHALELEPNDALAHYNLALA